MNYKLDSKLDEPSDRRKALNEISKGVLGLGILATAPLTVPRIATGVTGSIDIITDVMYELEEIYSPRPLPHMNELYAVRVEPGEPDNTIIGIINRVKREEVDKTEVQRKGTYIRRSDGKVHRYLRFLGNHTIYPYYNEVLIDRRFVRPELLKQTGELEKRAK